MNRQTTNHITTIKTEKFKTTTIRVTFKTMLARETVTQRILLANVLRNSSEKFTSKKLLSAHLEDLYGANLSVSARKQGQTHIISFHMQVVNEKFLKSAPPLFEDALVTLSEIIMKPNITNDAFDPEIVNLESRLLKEEIESIYDDKTSYALRKMIEKMCEGENFGITGDGYVEDLADINEKTLVAAYESMLANDEISIDVIGDVEHASVVKMIDANFNLKQEVRTTGIENRLSSIDREEKDVRGVVSLDEQQNIHQAKLNIGYRIGVRITDEDYFAALIFNGVFGGHASSKLFMNVREKESLCYYVGSQFESFKGLMYVYSGLDLSQTEKAMTIIDKQLDDICNGEITDQELQLAKNSYINAKRSALDSASGMLADLEVELILGITTAEFIQKLEAVTADEVSAVANKVKKDTIFILEPTTEEASS